MLDAHSNPFRGLFWGCVISSALWMTLLVFGVRAGRWLSGLI